MESKNRIIELLLIFSFFISCHSTEPTPANIIPKDSLVNIIVDLHLADAVLLNPKTQSKISTVPSNELYQTVLKKYHLRKERFIQSMNYYAEKPDVLDSVYYDVIEHLSLIQSNGYKDTLH